MDSNGQADGTNMEQLWWWQCLYRLATIRSFSCACVYIKLACTNTGSYPGAVQCRWCLQPPPAWSVWLRACWERHMQVARTYEVLWKATKPHRAWWCPGHHFTLHLARAIHSQGTLGMLAGVIIMLSCAVWPIGNITCTTSECASYYQTLLDNWTVDKMPLQTLSEICQRFYTRKYLWCRKFLNLAHM